MIIAFLLILASFIIYFNFIQPAYSAADNIKQDMLSRQKFVQEQQAAITQVKNLINSYKGETQLQDIVSLALPLNPDLAGAFAQINGLIQNNKLSLQGITVNLPVRQNISAKGFSAGTVSIIAKPLGLFTLQLRLTGTYEDFKAFLRNLETNIRIFDVEKLAVQQAAKPNQDIYIYDLTLDTYYQGQ